MWHRLGCERCGEGEKTFGVASGLRGEHASSGVVGMEVIEEVKIESARGGAYRKEGESGE